MAEKEQFVVPQGHLWEYIGDLSQEVLECSYNEDDIRSMWRRGTIDQEVKQMLATYHWRLKYWLREDGQYSDMLTAYVAKFGGWSPHWGWEVPKEWTVEEWGEEGPPQNVISPLSAEEQAIVDTFLAKYDPVYKE
jgi:hypothetical protein